MAHLALTSKRLTALILVVAVCGTAWILVQTWHGAWPNYDAVFYLSAGENLAAGRGLIDFRGNGMYWFPPGYSISLAGFELIGIGVSEGGRWLNAVVFGATILISGLWLKSVCRSPAVVMAGVLTIACSRMFQFLAVTLYSEPLYLLPTIGSLILVSVFLKNPERSRRALWLLAVAGLLAGLSEVVRYVGVVAVASSFGLLLLWRPGRTSMWSRLQAATVFGLAASLPVVAVLVVAVLARNLAVTGRLLGDRLGRGTDHTMLDALETIITLQGPSRPTLSIGLIMLLAAALIGLTAGRHHIARPPPGNKHGIERSAPFATFALLYAATLVLIQPFHPGPVNARLYLPAAIALVFVGCEALDTAMHSTARQEGSSGLARNLLLTGVSATVVLALASSSYDNVLRARESLALGHYPGAIIEGIAESPVITHLENHATDESLYSNRAMGVYLLTGIQPTRNLPGWWPGNSPLTEADCLDRLTAFASYANGSESRSLQIAWFDEPRAGSSRTSCDIPALAAGSSELELTQEFGDGAIYRFDSSR